MDHFRHYIHLRLIQSGHHGPGLTVKVVNLVGIEIGNSELAYTHAREGGEVYTSHSAQAGNGNPAFSQNLLLGRIDKTQIARKRRGIVKFQGHLGNARSDTHLMPTSTPWSLGSSRRSVCLKPAAARLDSCSRQEYIIPSPVAVVRK